MSKLSVDNCLTPPIHWGRSNVNNGFNRRIPTVPLWYKQQMTFLNPKFNQIRPQNDTFRLFIRLKNFQNLSALFS